MATSRCPPQRTSSRLPADRAASSSSLDIPDPSPLVSSGVSFNRSTSVPSLVLPLPLLTLVLSPPSLRRLPLAAPGAMLMPLALRTSPGGETADESLPPAILLTPSWLPGGPTMELDGALLLMVLFVLLLSLLILLPGPEISSTCVKWSLSSGDGSPGMLSPPTECRLL